MRKFLHDFFATIWWGVRTLWWDLWWGRPVRVVAIVLWLASLVLVLLRRSSGAVFLFELASGTAAILWIVPFLLGAVRLYRRIRHPLPAGWYRAQTDLSKDLRADWMQELGDLGFDLAGYLIKDRDSRPCIALFINSKNRDSAQILRVAGKDLLVFESRFIDGFAFETSNAASAAHARADHPVFGFPQISVPEDLYRVHKRIKRQKGLDREAVLSEPDGEITEFISRAEVSRRHILSRDYRLRPLDNVYVFTAFGAFRRAVTLSWPVKTIREVLFRRKMAGELTRIGFQIDKTTGRIVG
jgi:hypothetical protein